MTDTHVETRCSDGPPYALECHNPGVWAIDAPVSPERVWWCDQHAAEIVAQTSNGHPATFHDRDGHPRS